MRAAGAHDLYGEEAKIYDYIASNFLACISKDATYESIRMELLIGDEKFKMKGQHMITPGFLDVQPWQLHGDTVIPIYAVGDIVKVDSTKITEGRTDAPGYLTEAELISKMEEHGIGTDASIPTHINNIIERQYVTVQNPGRKLAPTLLGQALVKGYCEIDPELVMPQVRSNIERSCELVAKGKAEFSEVVDHVLQIFKDKFNFFKLNVGSMERLLSIYLNTAVALEKGLCLISKITLKDESRDEAVNFCIKCFKGYMCINYHNKKGWGLKCDSCPAAIRFAEGAARAKRVENQDLDKKCQECGSWFVYVYFKGNSPFPGKESHTGCMFCDPLLRGTIKSQLRIQKVMTPQELEE